MNTINWDLRNLIVQTHSGLRWSDIKRQLTDWRQLEAWMIGAYRTSESHAARQTLKPKSPSGTCVDFWRRREFTVGPDTPTLYRRPVGDEGLAGVCEPRR